MHRVNLFLFLFFFFFLFSSSTGTGTGLKSMVFRSQWIPETDLIDGDIIEVTCAALDIHNYDSSTNLLFTKVQTAQYRFMDACNMMYRLDIIAYNTSNKEDELYRVVASVPLNAIPHKSTLKLISFVQQRKLTESSFKQEHDLEKRRAEAAGIREKYPDRIPVIVEKSERSDIPNIDKKNEAHNRREETLTTQYERVRDRTTSSHVMQYGDGTMGDVKLANYQGFDPTYVDFPSDKKPKLENRQKYTFSINQRDVGLQIQWHRYKQADNGFGNKAESLQELRKTMRHRNHMDGSMNSIGIFLFGLAKASSILSATRQPGSPVVDDWDCYKSMIGVFQEHCGPLLEYGLKHVQKLANICNAGVSKEAMVEACNFACED